jgi:hypothetical protein
VATHIWGFFPGSWFEMARDAVLQGAQLLAAGGSLLQLQAKLQDLPIGEVFSF